MSADERIELRRTPQTRTAVLAGRRLLRRDDAGSPFGTDAGLSVTALGSVSGWGRIDWPDCGMSGRWRPVYLCRSALSWTLTFLAQSAILCSHVEELDRLCTAFVRHGVRKLPLSPAASALVRAGHL